MSALAPQVQSETLVEKIANAVLYEGYILYPYRPSAVKNQQRWNFGVVCPESYAIAQCGTENSSMQTECLLETNSATSIDLKVRFLQLIRREVAELIPDCRLPTTVCNHVVEEDGRHFKFVPTLKTDGKIYQTWQEAVEREIVVSQLRVQELGPARVVGFQFPASNTTEQLTGGLIRRTQADLSGQIEITTTVLNSVSPDETNRLLKLSVVIRNITAFEEASVKTRDDALMHSFVSTHTIFKTDKGAFVSLLDPADEFKKRAGECTNIGTFPVLVGEEGSCDCLLSSPIILYDYPQIASQSAGDLFDGTEIDEILTLRIMSLTDDEKVEMRNIDGLARQLLERTESMSAEQLLQLHGVMKKG